LEILFATVPPVWVLVAAFAIVVVASVLQSGLGMGFGLLAAPLLVLIEPELAPVPTLWIGFITSCYGAWAERRGVVWSEVGVGLIGRVAGIALALAVLDSIGNGAGFSLVFGLMVGLAVVLSLGRWQLPFNRGTLVGMATVSGLMATITSVGAPPMAMIYQSRGSAVARPTLAAFFAIGVGLSLIALHTTGHAGWKDVWLAALMVPPMILGTLVGGRVQHRFDRRYRAVLLGISGMAALMLIVRGLTWQM
jgi:uncharacterized membrane protein YfcA